MELISNKMVMIISLEPVGVNEPKRTKGNFILLKLSQEKCIASFTSWISGHQLFGFPFWLIEIILRGFIFFSRKYKWLSDKLSEFSPMKSLYFVLRVWQFRTLNSKSLFSMAFENTAPMYLNILCCWWEILM